MFLKWSKLGDALKKKRIYDEAERLKLEKLKQEKILKLNNLKKGKKQTKKEKKQLKDLNKSLIAIALKFGVFQRQIDLSFQHKDLTNFFF